MVNAGHFVLELSSPVQVQEFARESAGKPAEGSRVAVETGRRTKACETEPWLTNLSSFCSWRASEKSNSKTVWSKDDDLDALLKGLDEPSPSAEKGAAPEAALTRADTHSVGVAKVSVPWKWWKKCVFFDGWERGFCWRLRLTKSNQYCQESCTSCGKAFEAWESPQKSWNWWTFKLF